MVVVGPEDPLVKGIYDYFKKDEALKKHSCYRAFKSGCGTGRQQGVRQRLHATAITSRQPVTKVSLPQIWKKD